MGKNKDLMDFNWLKKSESGLSHSEHSAFSPAPWNFKDTSPKTLSKNKLPKCTSNDDFDDSLPNIYPNFNSIESQRMIVIDRYQRIINLTHYLAKIIIINPYSQNPNDHQRLIKIL